MAYNIAPSKQDTLVSGTNIKTINSNSILGSGNLTIAGLPTSTNPTDADKVVAVDSAGTASWQYAGLGGGAFPSNTVILGRGVPSGMTATSGILIGTGSNLGTGASQVIIGASSGRSTTGATGANNTVVGAGSFNAAGLTSAANCVVVGQGSATALTTGSNNTITGQGAAVSLNSGDQNCFYGTAAGYSVTTGQRLNCFGYNAGYSQTTSVFSVYVGAYSGYGSVLGSYNVAVGDTAMYNNTAGVTNATCLGYNTTAGASYAISIGSQAAGPGIAIGSGAASGSGANIVIGRGGGSDFYQANNGLCIGSDTYPINRVFLGMGGKNAADTTSQAVQIRTSNVIGGADKPATLGTLTLSGNQGTGSGLGSDVIISTSPAGTPGGTTPNAYVERFRCKSATEVVVNDTGVDFDFRVEGDTDANLLFVDAGTDRVGVGNNAPAVKLHTQATTAATNTVTNVLRVDSQSSGTPANGIGVGIEMAAETAVGNTEIGVVLEAVTTDVTSTSEDFDLVVKNMAAGATAAETLRVASTGTVTVANGDMILNTAGNGLKIKTGTDATAGLATISNGNSSVTVNTNKCSATSIILVTNQTSTAYVAVTTKTSGSFKIEHANTVGADQECAWFIINPA